MNKPSRHEKYINAHVGLSVVRRAQALSASIIIVIVLSIFSISFPSSGQLEKGAYIDEARFIHREDENLALEEVRNGNLDMYHFRIPLESADDAKNDPRLNVYERLAGSMGLFINPAPSEDDSTINPFQFREVRYAMNYLVDREFMVSAVLSGYGSPLVDPFGIYSPEYLTVIDVVESFGFRHNPQLADSMISEALSEAGATKQSGKWMYKGNPITVRIMIRQDDAPRKSMGEEVASQLEKIGITVQKDYGDLNKANTDVYGSDPQEFRWHIYTEGFAGTAVFVKYNPTIPAQMYSPWFTRMPGGQNPDFWNYENATIDDLTQRIFFFNFTSEAERNELVKSAVRAGVQESVRIFIAQKTDPFVASSKIEGLVNDFGAGITSKYSLLNARAEDGRTSLDVGVKQIHQGSWNWVAGLQDTYSRDIYHSIADDDTFRNPYTGEIIPYRSVWTDISTAGPLGKLDVPADAMTWDPASQQWTQVGAGTNAISKVAFKPLYSNWHHGIPMDNTDLMYGEYFAWEWGTDLGENDCTVDPEFTSLAREALQYSKGTRYVGPDNIETYFDIWHYDDTEIADAGTFWATEPWEITAASERLVCEGKLAYSRSEANARAVPWYDPISPEHARMMRDELQVMRDENFVPPALSGLVSVEDARKRYEAGINWIDEHDHAIINSGAFYLDTYNIAGRTITIKAFRDPTFPFEVGSWSKYENPALAEIGRVDTSKPIQVGEPASIPVAIQIGDKPSSEATVDYFIFDKDGMLAVRGQAAPSESVGNFNIELAANETSKLSEGPNELRIFASSLLALRPDITEQTILAVSGTGGNQTSDQTDGDQNGSTPQQPSGCLIATAAFGSELTPQVQYLRHFRDNYILSTASGSAFMNTFNSLYYSFSPQVADYERQQPWLQATVKAGLYPLFGILAVTEMFHFALNGGEIGAVAAGGIASSLIGAVYLWPVAFSGRLQSRFGTIVRLAIIALASSMGLIIVGIAVSSAPLLALSTSIFVLSAAAATAVTAARAARAGYRLVTTGKY
jgi:peptide/nickel transport system substrate-binding protein